jgi:hypothetical protein
LQPTKTPGDPPEQNSNRKRLPGEHKKRPSRTGVKDNHEDRHSPISFRPSLINCCLIRHARRLLKSFPISKSAQKRFGQIFSIDEHR